MEKWDGKKKQGAKHKPTQSKWAHKASEHNLWLYHEKNEMKKWDGKMRWKNEMERKNEIKFKMKGNTRQWAAPRVVPVCLLRRLSENEKKEKKKKREDKSRMSLVRLLRRLTKKEKMRKQMHLALVCLFRVCLVATHNAIVREHIL